ncbi:hypothetical protein OH460_07635 [Vibrio sp. Makdt]|uniref:hypothetical protein n=1 Tax=Vibrio sp. Makdt TaxID=2998828 RepID=UPI0022CD8264|nr:hypothetical protein [Vibrio sp. Makdt]MDA0152167.1 hypothetical protein [Vibrio sp. Makdt]
MISITDNQGFGINIGVGVGFALYLAIRRIDFSKDPFLLQFSISICLFVYGVTLLTNKIWLVQLFAAAVTLYSAHKAFVIVANYWEERTVRNEIKAIAHNHNLDIAEVTLRFENIFHRNSQVGSMDRLTALRKLYGSEPV